MRHFSFSVCISPPSPKPFEFLKHTAFLRSFETLHVDAAALKRTKWMENHHAIVLPLTGRPIKQGVDVNSVRLPWNSRKMWELAFIENLTLAFTLLYFFFFNAKCKVYKHNTVSQRCTFMQMTSSIFLLHAADQCKLKLVQLHVTPHLWTESCRPSALNYKTIWLKPSSKKNVCTSRALTLPTFLVDSLEPHW